MVRTLISFLKPHVLLWVHIPTGSLAERREKFTIMHPALPWERVPGRVHGAAPMDPVPQPSQSTLYPERQRPISTPSLQFCLENQPTRSC